MLARVFCVVRAVSYASERRSLPTRPIVPACDARGALARGRTNARYRRRSSALVRANVLVYDVACAWRLSKLKSYTALAGAGRVAAPLRCTEQRGSRRGSGDICLGSRAAAAGKSTLRRRASCSKTKQLTGNRTWTPANKEPVPSQWRYRVGAPAGGKC